MFANRIYLVVFISDYPLRALSILSSKVGRNVFYSRENKKTTTNIFFFFSIGEKFVATRNESEGRRDVY